jgi:hypothetical protein
MELPEQIVKWVRGDLGDRAFEQWVYASVPLLDAALGQERAMVFYELDFRDWRAVRRLQEEYEAGLIRRCLCPLMGNRQVFGLCSMTIDQGETREMLRRKPEAGWLTLERCRVCGTNWFVADDQLNDQWYLERLEPQAVHAILCYEQWPTTFDQLSYAWPRVPTTWPPEGFRGGPAWQLLLQGPPQTP